MSTEQSPRLLLDALEDTLSLLDNYGTDASEPKTPPPLPSLLQQCEELCAQTSTPPLRTIHHLACSGGTVISKCIAAMPNAILLGEIDPLSRMRIEHPDKFAPTDLLIHLRRSPRTVPDTVLEKVFQAGLQALHNDLVSSGQTLVLRDHAHSQFCTDEDPVSRPTLHELCSKILPMRSVVTIRHPLDAFLSLHTGNWQHFAPFTLEEFALRTASFLGRHQEIPIVRYEDFAAEPEPALQTICDHLDLAYSPLATDLIALFQLSGDSGRSGAAIALRERRPVPEEIEEQRRDSPAYAALCARFGYDI
ncbi:MAG: sulfotransferase [Pseudomonadota bacterium]